MRGLKIPLLILTADRNLCQDDYVLYFVSGGVLASRHGIQARFEFRECLKGNEVVVALRNFIPALPWQIYCLTQARIHSFVMARFQSFLAGFKNH